MPDAKFIVSTLLSIKGDAVASTVKFSVAVAVKVVSPEVIVAPVHALSRFTLTPLSVMFVSLLPTCS